MSTCLSNQTSLLMMLATRGEVTTRELARSLGITERAVHRILKELAEDGYISIGKRGYRNVYLIHREQSLGHPAFPGLTVGDMLDSLMPKLKIAPSNGTAAAAASQAVRLLAGQA